jgi:hypothetical protein
MAVMIVPEERRQKLCPVKYRVGFNAALLAEIALVRRLPPIRKELSHLPVSLWT